MAKTRGMTEPARQQQEDLEKNDNRLPSDRLADEQREFHERARARREENIRRVRESKGLATPSFSNVEATREQVTDTVSAEDQPAPANANQPRHGFDYTRHGVVVGLDENDNEIMPNVSPGTMDLVPSVVHQPDSPITESGMQTNRNFKFEADNQQLGTQPGVVAHPPVRFEGHPDLPPKEAEKSQRAMADWAIERLEENIWRDPVMAVRQFGEDLSNHGSLKGHTYAQLMRSRVDNGAGIDELIEIAHSLRNELPTEEQEKQQKEFNANNGAMNWHPVPVGHKWAGAAAQPVQAYPGEKVPAYEKIEDKGFDVHRQTAEEHGFETDWDSRDKAIAQEQEKQQALTSRSYGATGQENAELANDQLSGNESAGTENLADENIDETNT